MRRYLLSSLMLFAPADDLPPGGAGGASAPAVPPPGAGSATVIAPLAGGGDDLVLKKRIEDERASAQAALLKQHGFDKADELAAGLAELKKLRDSKLTAEERTKKELEEARGKATAGELASKTATEAVDALLETLTAGQKAALEEFAPAASASVADRLRSIRMIRKLGDAAPPATTATTITPPATTSPAPAPPRPGAKTVYDQWMETSAKNPWAAAVFYQRNKVAIEASRPA